MNSEQIYLVVIVAIVSIIFFLLIREVLTWYWKINKIVILLEQQNAALKAIYEKLSGTMNDKTK